MHDMDRLVPRRYSTISGGRRACPQKPKGPLVRTAHIDRLAHVSSSYSFPGVSSMSKSTTAAACVVGRVYEVDPRTLKIGTNVRADARAAAKDFAASIKARNVLEAITAWTDQDGALVVDRGQRRSLTATRVGTPSGTGPVRVIAGPTRQTGSPTS